MPEENKTAADMVETECVLMVHVLKIKNPKTQAHFENPYLFIVQNPSKDGEKPYQSLTFGKFGQALRALRDYLRQWSY